MKNTKDTKTNSLISSEKYKIDWTEVKKSEVANVGRADAEFYRTEYRNYRTAAQLFGAVPCSSVVADICYGIQAEPRYVEKGTQYIRALNLTEHGIDGDILNIEECQVPSADDRLCVGEILITRSGANCGDVGLVHERFAGATCGSYIIRMKLEGVSPAIAYIWLLSKYGRSLSRQIRTGAAQPNLSIPWIKKFLLFPTVQFRSVADNIQSLIRESNRLLELADRGHTDAEKDLLARMKWRDTDKEHALSFESTAAMVRKDKRTDAEYCQPKYLRLLVELERRGSRILGTFCSLPNRGMQPSYVENGPILVINSKHLGRTQIDIENAERTSTEAYNAEESSKSRINENDVLLYSTGAYIGRTNAYLETRPAIASNHVTIIRPDPRVCDPIYLALFLNSPPGLMQSEQHASGSAQREIYPQDICKFRVFVPTDRDGKIDTKWQNELARRVIEATTAKQQARKNLHEAQSIIETVVETTLKSRGACAP